MVTRYEPYWAEQFCAEKAMPNQVIETEETAVWTAMPRDVWQKILLRLQDAESAPDYYTRNLVLVLRALVKEKTRELKVNTVYRKTVTVEKVGEGLKWE